VKVLKELSVWAKEKGKPAEIKSKTLRLLLAKDKYGYTVWHRAAEGGRLEALGLWNWAKEVKLNTDELLVVQSKRGEISFHMAAKNNVEILHKLWVWAEEAQPNTNELEKTLLLAKDKYGYTAWHSAARFGVS
jgi:ankyrin repeat protein